VTTAPQKAGILAIDAGNSKTDVVLVAPDGSLLASARGGGFRPHILGAAAAVEGLVPLVGEVASAAGLVVTSDSPLVRHVSACLANSDLLVEMQRLEDEIVAHSWGVSNSVGNDTFALLRAGVDEPRGVAVICGAGINCVGLLPDGRTARFAAVGRISGDWGGGWHLAEEAMWWAARAEDGRGPETALRTALPAHFGLPTMHALIEAVHLGDLPGTRWFELTPVLFEVAEAGDETAREIVRRQAEEIVALAVVALRRLSLLDDPVAVVLGGGVLTAGHALLIDAIEELLKAEAPLAVPRVVRTPPIVGAALLGLDHIGASADAQVRLRSAFPGDVR
jgi:N-acetylglucosamine kinase-like BadF-type ATPase